MRDSHHNLVVIPPIVRTFSHAVVCAVVLAVSVPEPRAVLVAIAGSERRANGETHVFAVVAVDTGAACRRRAARRTVARAVGG